MARTAMAAPAPESAGRRGFWLRLLTAVLVVLLLRALVLDWHYVPSGSMLPNIEPGDRILVNKLAYNLNLPFVTNSPLRWNQPERGELVTFTAPGDGRRYVKRVLGVPGDRIAVQDGKVWLNRQPLHYAPLPPQATAQATGSSVAMPDLYRECWGGQQHWIQLHSGQPAPVLREMQIPDGHFLMLGDNRHRSEDSRSLGLVAASLLQGRVLKVLYGLDEGGWPRRGRWLHPLEPSVAQFLDQAQDHCPDQAQPGSQSNEQQADAEQTQ